MFICGYLQVASLSEVLNNFKQFSAEVALKHAALAGIRTDVRRSDIASNVKGKTRHTSHCPRAGVESPIITKLLLLGPALAHASLSRNCPRRNRAVLENE